MESIFKYYPELKKDIPYNKPFKTLNFRNTFKETQTLSFSNKSNIDDYEIFKKLLFKNIGKKFFPVMRISDGEMLLLTSFQNESRRSKNLKRIFVFFKNIIKYFIYKDDKVISSHIFGNFDHKTGTSETYMFSRKKFTNKELNNIKSKFLSQIDFISKFGILGIHYSYSNTPSIVEKYWLKFNQILKKYPILLNKNNCFPFYFIYMFLSEQETLGKAINKNNVLCISSAEGDKRENILNKIKSFKPKKTSWIKIPTSKTFFFNFNFDNNFDKKFDIIFLAAGTGKSNIIKQLQVFNCPIIDCGYIFEVWNDESLKYNRVGCVVDD